MCPISDENGLWMTFHVAVFQYLPCIELNLMLLDYFCLRYVHFIRLFQEKLHAIPAAVAFINSLDIQRKREAVAKEERTCLWRNVRLKTPAEKHFQIFQNTACVKALLFCVFLLLCALDVSLARGCFKNITWQNKKEPFTEQERETSFCSYSPWWQSV